MIKNIIKEIKGNRAVLLMLPNEKYRESIVEVAKQLTNRYGHLCYANLNKLHVVLIKELFSKKVNLQKICFIETITKTIKPDVKDTENVKYVSSPSALTELSLCIIGEYTKHNCDCLLFDSLSTLLVYHPVNIVTRFTQSMITKMEAINITIVFTLLEGDAESTLVKEMGMFVDKTVHMEEAEKKVKKRIS